MREVLVLICCAVIAGVAPQTIQDVDWKNFSYPLAGTQAVPDKVRWMGLGVKEAAWLANGTYVVHEDCSGDIRFCPSVTFDRVNYGHINGITSSVAAVVLTFHSGGTASWQYVYFFALEPGKPRLLAWLRTGSRGAQGLREVSIAGGELILAVNDPYKRRGDCCSAGSITTRYRWVGGSFSAIGKTVYKNDPPSFDCRKAAMPVERLICQDAELSYLDSQMAHSYQMALQGASAEGKEILRRQQAEWLADYSRACNAPLSETQRRNCIDRYLNDRLTTISK